MRYAEFKMLTEAKAGEVNLARRLKTQLSSKAQNAIESWEAVNWVDGDLSTAYSKRDDVYQEIEQAAETIRQTIRDREGDSVTLYRGLKDLEADDADRHTGRKLYSWTTRAKIAAVFAGLGTIDADNKVKLARDRETSKQFLLSLSDSEAKQIQDTVIQKGRAKWKNLYFKPSSDSNDYTDILLKKQNGRFFFVADEKPTDVAQWLIRAREDEKQFDQEVKSQGKDTGYVVQKTIPVDDIVWVLNAAGSMEYIVKDHSGINGKRVEL